METIKEKAAGTLGGTSRPRGPVSERTHLCAREGDADGWERVGLPKGGLDSPFRMALAHPEGVVDEVCHANTFITLGTAAKRVLDQVQALKDRDMPVEGSAVAVEGSEG